MFKHYHNILLADERYRLRDFERNFENFYKFNLMAKAKEREH